VRILWYYKYNRYYNHDEWLHAHFAKAISQYPGVELKFYGLYMEDLYPNMIVTKWDYDVTFKDIVDKFFPDIIILNTKSRMFRDYEPKHPEFPGNIWLPRGWDNYKVKIPRIMIEEDYFVEQNDDWYAQNNISLILQRHYSQYLRGKENGKVKHLWLPFSIDPNIFKPNPNITRKNRICFAGANQGSPYVERREACRLLSEANLIDIFNNKEKIGDTYIKCLQEYTCHLSGCLTHNINPSKNFEIMASGSVLLTNDASNGKDLLSPANSYMTYKTDCSNVLEKAKEIIGNYDLRKEVTENAMKCIAEKHTHEIRIKELLNIIEQEFGRK